MLLFQVLLCAARFVKMLTQASKVEGVLSRVGSSVISEVIFERVSTRVSKYRNIQIKRAILHQKFALEEQTASERSLRVAVA